MNNLSRFGIPELDLTRAVGGDDLPVVAGQYRHNDGVGVNSSEGILEYFRLTFDTNIPQPRRFIGAGTQHEAAIWGKFGEADFRCMAEQLAQLLAGCDIPQADGVVLTAA